MDADHRGSARSSWRQGPARVSGVRKLAAQLDGRPILQHVLDALAEAGIDDPVVVDGGPIAAEIEWGAARPVTNPEPGSRARELAPDRLGRGDGRRRAAGRGDRRARRPAAGPHGRRRCARHRAAGRDAAGRRPAVQRAPAPGTRSGWSATRPPLVEAATGDRGLGPILDDRPELVRWLDVDGDNPDVDTREDLAQRGRARLGGPRPSATANRSTGSGRSRTDPTSMPRSARSSATTPIGRAIPSSTPCERTPGPATRGWTSAPAPAGTRCRSHASSARSSRSTHPRRCSTASRVGEAEHGIENVRVVAGRWPEALADDGPLADSTPVDVALIAHVGYDVEAIGPFIDGDGAGDDARVPRGPDGAQPRLARGAVLAADPRGGANRAPGPARVRRPAARARPRTRGDDARVRAAAAGLARRDRGLRAPPDVDGAGLREGPAHAGADRRVARPDRRRRST